MSRSSRTIRLFVSSIFSDFKAERDLLQREVFPRLRQHCLSKGLRFKLSTCDGVNRARPT